LTPAWPRSRLPAVWRLWHDAVQTLRSEVVKVTYDAETDTLTVLLRDAKARVSEEERSGVILDYDANDRLIAIEILDASSRVDGVDTVQLQIIPKPGAVHPEAAE
jgi:YD repeat-containing protein